MASNKSVLDVIESQEYIELEAELEETLKQRKTVDGRIRLQIEKIKETFKWNKWASKKPKSRKQKKRRNARIIRESDPKPDLNENIIIYESGINFIEMFGKLFGFYMSFKWKPNPRFWFSILCLSFSWFHFFYTQCLSLANGELTKVLEVFAIYGIGTSILTKTLCICKYYKRIKASLNFTFKLCRTNATGRRAENLKFHLLNNVKLYKFITFLAVCALSLYVANPIKAFIIDGEFLPLLPIEIIFVDQSTQFGLLLANIFMTIMGICAFCVSIFGGLLFVALIRNYSMQVGMIDEDIKDLDEMWSGKSKTTVAYRRAFLRNICEKYQDMNEYVNVIKEIFETTIFVHFCVTYISQIICLFEIKVNNWISGYGIALESFNEMIFYCIMGTQLAVDHDRLHFILTQSNWYTYDLHSQKIFRLLLHFSMNGSELWIGPLAPLNVYTASEIVKSIYTYYTIMIEIM